MKPATQLFRENEKMIYKFSHSFSQKYSMEFEEIKSQAFEVFMKAIEKYNPERKANFNTYLYYCLKSDLRDYVVRQVKDSNHYIDEPFESKSYSAGEASVDLLISAEFSLSSDAFYLFQRLFQGDFWGNSSLGCTTPPGKMTVYKQLQREGLPWTQNKIRTIWTEMHDFWQSYKTA